VNQWIRWLIVVWAAMVFMALAVANRAPGPARHVRFGQGDCAACHEAGGTVSPADHQSAGWPVLHGRSETMSPARCVGCHSVDACQACHLRPPPTHTAGFRRPNLGGPGATQHAMLGRLRAVNCVTCHEDAPVRCAQCHSVQEARGWVADAEPARADWRRVVGEAKEIPHGP
jgi:hypothetical protein